MKVGILTQPLGGNYGGLLQAYALQIALKELGHTPVTVDRTGLYRSPLRKSALYIRKFVDSKFGGRKFGKNPFISREQKAYLEQNLRAFRDAHVSMTEEVRDSRGLAVVTRDVDAFIVGSDQVWRPMYSPWIYDYFLEFAVARQGVRRISYAASFGTDKWEMPPAMTQRCARLLARFDHVSVREESALAHCREKFGKHADLVLDPVALLPGEHYRKFLNPAFVGRGNSLGVYVLDGSVHFENLVSRAAETLGLDVFRVMPQKPSQVEPDRLAECVLPEVPVWLSCFASCSFIVTDSFHGTLLSILFNRPFVVYANASRGVARLTSLLKATGLEHRLVSAPSEAAKELFLGEINWKSVNKAMHDRRDASVEFLRRALSS